MAKEILSPIEKTRLVIALSSINFLNDDDTKPFRCMVCNDVSIYHYFATCQHLFCGKCHGSYANKACPIDNCTNESIHKVSHSMDFESKVYDLKALCKYKDDGCNDIVTLSEFVDHKHKCQFSTRNRSNTWSPTVAEFDKMVKDIANLKKDVEELKREMFKCNCASVGKRMREEIEELRRTFDRNLNHFKDNLLDELTLYLARRIMDRQRQETAWGG